MDSTRPLKVCCGIWHQDISSRSFKPLFGKAIHALSRIGDELWLDPLKNGLALRLVNSAHSACACFVFSPLFFLQYKPDTELSQDPSNLRCKLAIKSVFPLFRCLAAIERSVERCKISISVADSQVAFQFFCKHGITKTHNLGFQECESLQAVFPARLCPNMLRAQASLLGDIVRHFPLSLEEVTLCVSPVRVKLKNYYEEENDITKAMCTELSLHPEEFDYFQVGVESDVTFCLKELRGFLSFAESHGLPVSVQFGPAGKPVSFSVEDMVLEANVVLATLADTENLAPVQTAEFQAPVSPCKDPTPASKSPAKPDLMPDKHLTGELVPSSQGSPVFNGLAQISHLLSLKRAGGVCGGAVTVGPAIPTYKRQRGTSQLECLLFGALSSQHTHERAPEHPSLACASDTEEEAGEDRGL